MSEIKRLPFIQLSFIHVSSLSGRITFGNSKKMSFAYPSDMRHFLLLSTRLFSNPQFE